MRNLLRLILPLLMVQGCAGNPVAQQLERSFDQPAESAPSPAAATAPKGRSQPRQSGSDSADLRTETQSPAASDSDRDKTGEAKSEPSSKADSDPSSSAGAPTGKAVTQENRSDAPRPEDDEAGDITSKDNTPEPQKAGTLPPSDLPKEPYRITIRVSEADPASPAEAVTRALREAGVPFAVEQIEQIEPTKP